MPVITKGSFSLNLGLLKFSADISEQDRQCAWELYTEITTRLSLTGKRNDSECKDFSGEVLVESLDSIYAFFRETRGIMRKFPVGQLKKNKTKHLGVLINDLMARVLRPFLEKWQADFRHWWNHCDTKTRSLPPFKRQEKYRYYKEFINDWRNVRLIMRELQLKLVKVYQLINVDQIDNLLPHQKSQQ